MFLSGMEKIRKVKELQNRDGLKKLEVYADFTDIMQEFLDK